MDIIQFLTILKAKSEFNIFCKNLFSLATSLLLLLALIVIGFGFGNFIDLADSGAVNFDSEILKNSIIIAIATIVLLKSFFPTYKPLSKAIPEIYPIGNVKSVLIDIYLDLISPVFIFIYVFICSLTIASCSLGVLFFFYLVSVLFCAHLSTRIMQTLLEKKIKFSIKSVMVIMIVMIISGLILNSINTTCGIYLFFISINLFLIDILLETHSKIKYKTYHNIRKNFHQSIYFQLLFYNHPIRMSLLVSFLLKIIMLGANIGCFLDTGKPLFGVDFVLWIFLSPFIVFANVFNNIWGYYKKLWLNVNISGQRFTHIFQVLLKLIFGPLLFDLIITAIYLSIMNTSWLPIIIYLFITLSLSIFSIYWSFFHPLFINKTITLGTRLNTSPISLLCSLLIVLVNSSMSVGWTHFIIIPINVISLLLVLIYLNKYWQTTIHKLFVALYKF